MKLDGYVRVSRVGGRGGESFISPDVQRGQIETWAKLRGATIVTWHVDLDESGGSVKRPGLEDTLRRCEAGLSDGLVVAKIDRFARTLPGALETITRLDAVGAQFVSVAEGIDPTTPAGKMMQRLLLVLAEFELDRIRESWKVAQERAVARGVHIASASPTGYVRGEGGVLVPHEVFGPVVGDVFRLRAAGGSWGDVIRLLEASAVVGPYGGTRWQRKNVRRMLSNRVYLGEARSGAFVKIHAHPPLTDRKTFDAVQEAPQAVIRGDGALLSGLLRCAGCGYALKADTMKSRSGERMRLYRCRGVNPVLACESKAAVLGSVIEPRIVQWFLDWLGTVEVAGAEESAAHEAADSALQEAEADLEAYRDDAVISILGRDEWLRGLRSRAERVTAAHDQLRAAAPASGLPSQAMLAETWPTLSMGEKRMLLAAGIDVVFIRSGRTLPIEDRVAVFGKGDWSGSLPRVGRPLGPQTVLWDRLPEGARLALAHDLGEDLGD